MLFNEIALRRMNMLNDSQVIEPWTSPRTLINFQQIGACFFSNRETFFVMCKKALSSQINKIWTRVRRAHVLWPRIVSHLSGHSVYLLSFYNTSHNLMHYFCLQFQNINVIALQTSEMRSDARENQECDLAMIRCCS